MKISIGSDHAGFQAKGVLASHLRAKGLDVADVGAFSDSPSDYPDFAKKVAAAVASRSADLGVLICGSGIGMCMAANRVRGVRAAVIRSAQDAEMSRRHNGANVACFAARFSSTDDICSWMDLFLNTQFEGGRHQARIDKLDA
jgi:ribose 5-phosphate isomerase B